MSQIVEAYQAMSEREMQKVQILDEFAEKVLTELDIKRSDISKLQEERIAARDKMQRLEIHAPISGYVHELNVHTIGGVVSPGETLVTIIPNDDNLIVEAKLSPKDVDEVHNGQKARLRLTSMDQRVTPQIYAHVIDISPDLLTERQTGVSYYLARLRIEPEELVKIGDEELRPGMPVEVSSLRQRCGRSSRTSQSQSSIKSSTRCARPDKRSRLSFRKSNVLRSCDVGSR